MTWIHRPEERGFYHRALLNGAKDAVLYRGIVEVVDATRMHGKRLLVNEVPVHMLQGMWLGPIEIPSLPSLEEMNA